MELTKHFNFYHETCHYSVSLTESRFHSEKDTDLLIIQPLNQQTIK